MRKIINYRLKAFTMVELLVVISIIGVLAGILLVSYGGVQKQARNTQRKSDLKQYQNALETYANNNNSVYPFYVNPDSVDLSGTVCVDLGITGCPEDPNYDINDPNPPTYRYLGADGTEYVIWSILEGTTNFWFNCSNGKSGEDDGPQPTLASPDCPL